MNDKKSLRVVHLLAGDLWGGKEAQVFFQLQKRDPNDGEVRILLFNEGFVAERFRSLGLGVDILNEANGLIQLLSSCHETLKLHAADILVAHGYKEMLVAAVCAWRLALKWIAVFHGRAEPHRGWKGLKLRVYEFIALFLARNSAAAIVCVSAALAKDLGLHGFPSLRIIYNVHTRSDVSSSSKTSLFERRPAIYMIARLVSVKRVDLALEALKEFLSSGDAVLYLAGDGPEQEALLEKVSELSLQRNVAFLGFRQDATELIDGADALLITSDSEGIPTVLLDAIWYGVPVVSTAVGGIPEVMQHFPGYPVRLIPAGNRVELTRALEDCRRLGNRSLAPSSRMQTLERLFSPQSAAKQFQRMYREVYGG